MSIKEDIFKLIKNERKFLSNIEDYTIKISNSENFEKENLIGIFKIRKYNAVKNKNQRFIQQFDSLISNLENYPNNKLRFVSILNEKYYGIFYFGEFFDKVIVYCLSPLKGWTKIVNQFSHSKFRNYDKNKTAVYA